ncbi:ATP-dependent helicase [Amnibacterium kyonggiense]|uniref:DNA 3'-5' helicase n=1 Tax=Amnibacterium kyonggiense TaxID=595671 RepID=A0A4R7FF33_9MICO|nr:ATP-dependent helicase [Amnibacterium kyonggiense]TDS75959.1 Rep family ATP-dependent DNA helicase [Amnibacterium kyonggiense]
MSDADALLDALDEQQRAAAEALTGAVCVLAGAGTGKTRTITHRIAYGVATGVFPPKRVMALTFTTRAAAELRARLASLGAPGIAARTFHSAALAQLNHFWPQLMGSPAPSILDGKARLIARAAEGLRLRLGSAALKDAAGEIEFRKTAAMTMERYVVAAADRVMPEGLDVDAMIALAERYETIKDEQRLIDFEDVLLATTGMIESEPQVATEVREQYRFFTVDEYQDVSPAQQGLLEAWLGDHTDVCVVGDASQTIYSFAGAQSEYLLRFGERPGASVVRLEHNYRSVDGVVKAANSLMTGRRGALTLTAVRRSADPREPVVQVRDYADDADEAAGVAQAVAAQIASGTAPADIAVLVRINAQAAVLEQAFAAQGVAVTTGRATRYFEQPVVRKAIELLRAAVLAKLDEPLVKSVSDALRQLGHTHHAPQGPGEQRTQWELLDALGTLAEQAPAGTTLPAFVAELAERAAAQHEPPVSAVSVLTLHAAKGLEWPVVHLIGCSEGLLPISYATTAAEVEEERRLLYVGITRARDRLRVSWARSAAPRPGERRPSRFLSELGPAVPLPQATGTSTARARVGARG